jgi:hypothetical protein
LSAWSALAVSESIMSVGQSPSWQSRKAGHSSMQQNGLVCEAGRPWLTWSSGSIAAACLRWRSLPAEDASRHTLLALARGSSRLPSDHPTDVRTEQRRGH